MPISSLDRDRLVSESFAGPSKSVDKAARTCTGKGTVVHLSDGLGGNMRDDRVNRGWRPKEGGRWLCVSRRVGGSGRAE